MRNQNRKEPFFPNCLLDTLARKSIPVAASLPIISTGRLVEIPNTGSQLVGRILVPGTLLCLTETFPAPNHYAHVFCASAVQGLITGRMVLRVVMRLKPQSKPSGPDEAYGKPSKFPRFPLFGTFSCMLKPKQQWFMGVPPASYPNGDQENHRSLQELFHFVLFIFAIRSSFSTPILQRASKPQCVQGPLESWLQRLHY